MRAWLFFSLLFPLSSVAAGQAPGTTAFEVASVKPSGRQVGADYNNRFAVSPAGIAARNATLRRLISEAYRLQVRQVVGPGWLDQNEYDLDARAGTQTDREQMALMLRTLLSERFNLKQHRETREMRSYELLADKAGIKIPTKSGEPAKAGAGLHFHGDMRQFADLLAVQFSIPILDDPSQPGRAGGPAIPVLDRTGLSSAIFDFAVDVTPELGTDSFTLWQRALREQLGLRIEAHRGPVEVLVVDDAAKVPNAN